MNNNKTTKTNSPDYFESRYKTDTTTENSDIEILKAENKRLKSDLEGATSRILLISLPTSNAHKDALRWRKNWGFSEVVK